MAASVHPVLATSGVAALVLTFALAVSAQEPGARDAREFVADRVLPFAFTLPEGWGVWQSPKESRASAWLMAAPAEAEADDFRNVSGILRVTAIGHEPALVLAPDRAERSAALARAQLSSRGPADAAPTIVGLGDVDLGAVRGGLLLYRHPARSERRDGVLLHAAFGTGLLLAEIDWAPEDEARCLEPALARLRSFRAAFDGERTDFDGGEPTRVAFRYPRRWGPPVEVRTPDASRAWQLESPEGFELVLRSLPLPPARGLDEAGCRTIATAMLAESLQMFSAEDVAEAIPVSLPGAGAAIRLFRRQAADAREALVFERGGAVHLAFLRVPRGEAGLDRGEALEILLSLRGPAEPRADDPWVTDDEGRLKRRLALRRPDLGLFARDGAPKTSAPGLLRLDADGRFRLFGAPDAGLLAGRYRIAGGSLILAPVGGEERKLLLDPGADRVLDTANGAAFYRVPDLP